ncbi:unnamed protein product [Calypogeia fissa]
MVNLRSQGTTCQLPRDYPTCCKETPAPKDKGTASIKEKGKENAIKEKGKGKDKEKSFVGKGEEKADVEKADNPQKRMKIDSIQLCTMVSAYNVFFKRYSDKMTTKGKKTTQLIPTKVWVDVYDIYKSEFPDSSFTQVHLKEKLRETLKDIGIGNSNA